MTSFLRISDMAGKRGRKKERRVCGGDPLLLLLLLLPCVLFLLQVVVGEGEDEARGA